MESFLEQDYPDKEHIIIDGKSSDNTVAIVKEYNPEVLISEPDNGLYDAINKGIKHCSGDIIALLHADDVFADKYVISKMEKLIREKNVDTAYADLLYVQQDNVDKYVRYWKSGEFSKKKLSNGWMPPHPTFFVKRVLYEKYGTFNIDYKIAADYDIMTRLLGLYSVSTAYCPEVTIKMRVGGKSNRSLGNIIRKSKEDFKIARANKIGGLFTVIFKNLRKLNQFSGAKKYSQNN
jgi:glycosyltransferase